MVRDVTRADLPMLLAIQSISLGSPQPGLLRLSIDGPTEAFVAGNPPVGYALVVGRAPTHLVELAVAPDHRGVGHGSALLTAVLARGECRLTTRADADRVRAFYERHGFRVERVLDRYYDGADGVLFVCQPDFDSGAADPLDCT